MKLVFKYILLMTAVPALFFGVEWSEYGMTAVSSDSAGIVLSDDAGNSIIVKTDAELDDEMIEKIISLKDDFYSWDSMSIDTITFSKSDGSLDVVVLPSSLVVAGEDVSSQIPAGMLFYYEDGETAYDFRMMEGSVFMHIKGLYITEAQLLEKIAVAVDDPDAYIQREDFDYVLARLETLGDEVDVLEAENYKLRAEVEEMRDLIMALVNHGLFGGPTEISDKLIETVTAYKDENPSWTIDQVAAELSAQGVEYKKRAVELIFIMYYQEFE